MDTSKNNAYPRFEKVKGSDFVLVGLMLLATAVQVIVLLLIRNLVDESGIFWLYYIIWAGIFLLLATRKIDSKKKQRQGSYVFVLVLFASLFLSKLNPAVYSFNLAFVGYFLGAVFYGIVIVLKRHL